MKWSIRNLLNPVITRVLLFGTNSIDLEYVLREVEKKPLLNSKALENTWSNEWDKKAKYFIELSKSAESKAIKQSVYQYNMLAAQCYYACYMINSDNIEKKRDVYTKLAKYYKKAIDNLENKTELLKISMNDNKKMYCYLHLPDSKKFCEPYPCAIIFSGIGSCKEELEMLARPLIDRGVAVLACDMPGTGQTLFEENIKCKASLVEEAFEHIIETLEKREDIDDSNLASYGLCMGGGYAYRMASLYDNVKCCINLFPLFFEYLSNDVIPRWMKMGNWASFQYGEKTKEEVDIFGEEMSIMSRDAVKCDYMIIYSIYDNWMKLDDLDRIYKKSLGYKEKILIDEEPVYATKEAVMHAMPVGEQMHWIKHVVADWICERIAKKSDSKIMSEQENI